MKIFMRIGFSVLAVALYVGIFSSVSFAEGDAVCSGRIAGITPAGNQNSGVTSFNSHQGFYQQDNAAVSLAAAGLGMGLAPNNREYAACLNEENGNVYGANYEYALKGWSWNNNLGFISFSCVDGKNIAGGGGGLDCGAFNYGVFVGSLVQEPFVGRYLFGYGYNPTFGWIKFQGQGISNGQLFDYGVIVDRDGNTSGYAWTEAGIYLNFNGLKLDLPGDNLEVFDDAKDDNDDNWCEGKSWVCVQVKPDPGNLEPDPALYTTDSADRDNADGGDAANVRVDDGIKIADGQDGYYIHLYLRDGSGNALASVAANYNYPDFINSIIFNWDDTVKLNQTSDASVGNALDLLPSPVTSKKGAVVWKPIRLNFQDFVSVDDGEPGHYVSRRKIASYAPTSESNLSFTTSTNPSYAILNEDFLTELENVERPVEKNQLIFKSVSFDALIHNQNGQVLPGGVVYPNGKVRMSLKFKPALMINTLYAGLLEDVIVAYRSLTTNIKFGMIKLGRLSNEILDTATVTLNLAYSQEETDAQNDCDPGYNVFDFHFLRSFQGRDINAAANNEGLSEKVKGLVNSMVDLPVIAELPAYNNLPEGNEVGLDPEQPTKKTVLPCQFAEAPTLYSIISYVLPIGDGLNVSYYANKLPRLGGGEIFNPVAVVHGSLVGQAVANVRYGNTVQTSGSVNVATVRDAINENLKKFGAIGSLGENQVCTVKKLLTNQNQVLVEGCNSSMYKAFSIGDERIIYFKGHPVRLDLMDGIFNGKWVIIADGGNVFIDNDIYNEVTDNNSLSIIVFRDDGEDFGRTGHVYVGPCAANRNGPRNIQATILADGSMFPYTGFIDQLNEENGEPEFESFEHRISLTSCQLLVEGAIYSDNTVGGADLDKGDKPKNYLLLGGGEVLQLPLNAAQRLRAQYYDLNYLRLFTLDLETGPNGCPIDQKCGKALCADDVIKIANDEKVCGEFEPCNENNPASENLACDGINPFDQYKGAGDDGDLIVKANANVLARGLNNTGDEATDFDPVYIFQRDYAKDSFLFKK